MAVLVAVSAQAAPLLEVLGYEFATLVSLTVSTLGLGHVVARWNDYSGSSRWVKARSAAADLAVWVVIMGAISLANALRVRSCEPGVGVAYLLVLGFGAIPFVVATAAVASSAARGRLRFVVAASVVVASFASSLAWLALQPGIVVYNPFFGYFAGSIYDESLVAMRGHLLFRGWNLAWAVLLIAGLELERTRRLRDAALIVATLAVIAPVWAWRGDLGLERGRAYVAEALGGYVSTEHFEIYYDARSFDAREVELLVSDHEARYVELAAFWQHEPRTPLRSFVYGDRTRKGDLMGGYRTLVAKIWLGEMHITWDGLGAELLAHEMAHLFLRDDGSGPLRLSSRYHMLPLMALVEGAATAAAWGASELDYHHWAAAIYRLEIGEEIDEVLGPVGFWSRYSRRAYTLVGSFARWLIETEGPERFRRAYGLGDFEGAYGRPLADLVAGWRVFLEGLTLTDEQMEAARYRYDRPSLFGRLCARSIATRFEDAEWLAASGRVDEARRRFESIMADDPGNVAYRLRIAERYVTLGAAEAAEGHAEQVLDADGAGLAQRGRAAELLADMAWRRGAVGEALASYEELLVGEGTEAGRRRLLAKIQSIEGAARYPLTVAAVRRYLVERPSPSGEASIAELLWAAATEGSSLSRYLAGIRLSGDQAAVMVPDLLSGLDVGALDPSQVRMARRSLARHLSVRGLVAEACTAWEVVADVAAGGSALAAEAEMWLGRCGRGTMPPPAGDPG